MSDLSRIGVAIDANLLKKFDHLISTRGYTNRSEAFRDLIRDELIEKMWERPDANVVGTVTLVYDHHVRLLNEKLTDRNTRTFTTSYLLCTCIWITITASKCWWYAVSRWMSGR